MKKTMLKLMILVIGISAIQSCKKGDEDPFLSLRTRKARLTGEWKVTAYNYTSIEDGIFTDKSSISGDMIIYTDSDGETESSPFTMEYTFEKDGRYENVINEDGSLYTAKGGWYFSEKNKDADLKKKECLIIDLNSEIGNASNTYSVLQNENQQVFEIIKLSNKEIKLKSDLNIKYNSDGSSYQEIFEFTLTKIK